MEQALILRLTVALFPLAVFAKADVVTFESDLVVYLIGGRHKNASKVILLFEAPEELSVAVIQSCKL